MTFLKADLFTDKNARWFNSQKLTNAFSRTNKEILELTSGTDQKLIRGFCIDEQLTHIPLVNTGNNYYIIGIKV